MISHVLFLFVCAIWGASFIFMKLALPNFGYLGIGAYRLLLGAAALWLLWNRLKKPWPFRREDWLPLLGIALIGYAIPFVIQPYVIAKVEASAGHGSAFGGLLVSFVPLLTIIASIPLLGVWPSRRQLLGVIGGLAFMWALFAEELAQGVALPHLLIGAVTPVCYGFANTYVKRRFHHVPPMALSMVTLALATVILLPLSLTLEEITVNANLPAALTSLAALGVVCTGLAGYAFYRLVQGHGPLYAGMVSYVIPCVAMLIGWTMGERITRGQILCMAGVFAMVALVQFKPPPASRQVLEVETIE